MLSWGLGERFVWWPVVAGFLASKGAITMRCMIIGLVIFACACGGAEDKCVPLLNQATDAIAMNKACSQDSDCVLVMTACSLPGQCGAAVNSSVVEQLKTIAKNWKSECSSDASQCPHCPSPPTGVKCDAGRCVCVPGGCDS